MIDPNDQRFSVREQMELLDLNRSSYYYLSSLDKMVEDLDLKRKIDKVYTEHPFFGYRRICNAILQEYKIIINKKHCLRLMREMGLMAIYPTINLSKANKQHLKYPYLLRNKKITRQNQVWCSDITYIPMNGHFAYLVVIMDWFSRYILNYKLSTSLESSFCIDVLRKALKKGIPEINNTDQGSQFTCEEYISILKNHGIKISMDGRGRAFDNIMVERFWRTIKYEDIYLKDYNSMIALEDGIKEYIAFYNNERPHFSLDNRTPKEIYCENNKLIKRA